MGENEINARISELKLRLGLLSSNKAKLEGEVKEHRSATERQKRLLQQNEVHQQIFDLEEKIADLEAQRSALDKEVTQRHAESNFGPVKARVLEMVAHVNAMAQRAANQSVLAG